jgi:hypothetical protein
LLLRKIHKASTDRSSEDDVPEALLLEDSGGGLRGVESSIEIDLHDLAPLFASVVFRRLIGCNSGVGDDDIQFPKIFGDFPDNIFDFWLIANVGLICRCLDIIRSFNLRCNGIRIFGRVVDDGNLIDMLIREEEIIKPVRSDLHLLLPQQGLSIRPAQYHEHRLRRWLEIGMFKAEG